jgi:hypothetical protein
MDFCFAHSDGESRIKSIYKAINREIVKKKSIEDFITRQMRENIYKNRTSREGERDRDTLGE